MAICHSSSPSLPLGGDGAYLVSRSVLGLFPTSFQQLRVADVESATVVVSETSDRKTEDTKNHRAVPILSPVSYASPLKPEPLSV